VTSNRIDNAIHYVLRFTGQQAGSVRYARNILWSFFEKFIKFLAELLIGFYIARMLGVSNFGVLNYAISFIVMFQGIASLGLSEILTRELITYGNQKSQILSTALFLRVVVAIFFVVVINLISWFEFPQVRLILFIVSLSLVFRSFESLIYYFQSIVKSEKVSRIQITRTILISLAKIYLIYRNAGVVSFAWVYSIEWFIIAIGLVMAYLKTEPGHQWKVGWKWGKRLLLNSWTLMLSAAAVNIYMRMDQVMIRQMINDTEIGYYAAAVRLTEFWYIIPMILCGTLFPALLNARKISKELYQTRLLMLNAFLFWTSFILALLISPWAYELITLLYNETYGPASIVLAIHIWSAIFTFLGVSGSYWLMAENLQHVSLLRTTIGLVVNFVLNILLIPTYGAAGAAVATLVTQVLATTASLLLLAKTRKLLAIQYRSIYYPAEWMVKRMRK
jgi:O-antigen/teichoic acid export membrane protein